MRKLIEALFVSAILAVGVYLVYARRARTGPTAAPSAGAVREEGADVADPSASAPRARPRGGVTGMPMLMLSRPPKPPRRDSAAPPPPSAVP